MNRICLVVLIGLPGAGKTTFCQHLMQMELLPFNILHICYDDLINFNPENPTQYKIQRENILKFLKETAVQFKHIIKLPEDIQAVNIRYKCHQRNDIVILCDDNHYYRSMRYKVFQIAREESLGYCQIYVDCKPQLAVQRNSLRNDLQKLPNDVILQMHSRLEVPDTLEHQWEENTMMLQASNLGGENYNEIISFITLNLTNPVQPLKVSVSKSATAQSKVHELDLLLRKHIKFLISSSQHKNSILAKSLNDKRTKILELFQKDIACSCQDMDLNKYIERFDHV